VYSPRESVIGCDELVAALESAGWRAAIPPAYVWIGGAREARSPALTDYVEVYGWTAGELDRAEVQALVDQLPLDAPGARNTARDRLASLAVVGCSLTCGVYGLLPEQLEDNENDESLTADRRARLAATRTQYVLRGRWDLDRAVEFQKVTGLAIATLTGGIGLYPGSGEWLE